MVELVTAMGVYHHKAQFQTVFNEAAPVVSPRAKTASEETKLDGKRVSRYLLSVFFSKEQLANSSLTNSDMAQYPALNQQIVDAVIRN
ncbi:hypothetical protein ACF0H5_021432 [Mactra antiquata]